ncbi:MAG TPA: PIN domain-containing protein, partial [Polyangiaceae bacterium]|nr:PIN domain-containing protein [Polyangiaceae bacterium]
MADVVLDANVIIGVLDAQDSLHEAAKGVLATLVQRGSNQVLLDAMVGEAVSVLCRRAAQRKSAPPDLSGILQRVRAWYEAGQISFIQGTIEVHFSAILGEVEKAEGKLNFNDALLVVLQRA